ncbi:hypothetical protein IG631_10976 [Alternaria alternata]|nr:hypothetical protein IG631_10976 [Alternaria alternata]
MGYESLGGLEQKKVGLGLCESNLPRGEPHGKTLFLPLYSMGIGRRVTNWGRLLIQIWTATRSIQDDSSRT